MPLLLCLLGLWCTPVAAAEVRVLAASSLTDALAECGRRYTRSTGATAPVFGFASSSRLARQIEAGAHVDIVLTADPLWMDVLTQQAQIDPETRRTLLRNALAVVVPRGAWAPDAPDDLKDARIEHLAVAGVAVPAGRRAREAMKRHHLLEVLRPRTVLSTNVRAALSLVSQGEVDAAVVYSSDARATDRVDIAFVFPDSDHAPILYPVALTPEGVNNPGAQAFYEFLFSPAAADVFVAAGFHPLVRKGTKRVPIDRPTWLGTVEVDQGGWRPVPLSLWVASLSVLLTLPPGILLGWVLARRDFYGKTLVTVATMSPLVLPPVVTGFLLLRVFGRHGVLGPLMQTIGLDVAFTRWGAVVAAAVVGFPLLVQLVRGAIEAVDPRYEQVAQTLGRHPLHAFATITFPLALPGIAAGAVLAFTRALGEFGATAVLAGDVPGETRTLALALFAHYETPGQEDAAMRLVWISIALCAVALAAYEVLTRMQRRRLEL